MIKLKLTIKEFDYSEKLDKYLPRLLQYLKNTEYAENPLFNAVCSSPEGASLLLKGIFAAMSQSQKDLLAERLINSNEKQVVSLLNQLIQYNHIGISIGSAVAKATPEPTTSS